MNVSDDVEPEPRVVVREIVTAGKMTPDRLMNQHQTCEFLGGRNKMWIWRRLRDPASGFPRPTYLGRRPHWWYSQLVAYTRSPDARWTPRSGAKS